ncbi:dTDP-4-dehydrorhamnose 3,5-epimerase [Pontimonas salivibrio]|uniref:dTDP-4-dehydrorhamnose 3,5-epimerase n=1 Tax=Pontimonas salivibrio TaxID=1159327 RepID=A0A2L2BSB9_9MICO|nr:dTDP-4-dehydrorhamnose 3,5-epimerase family protein [Pontimonas salivibrio]AVG24573.1 dTDP-4-dehydrorhamnose 3,5-epimerase [Pontimonas salivibrio]
MEFVALGIAGAFEVRNVVHADDRGEFAEWFRFDHIEANTGYRFPVRQANVSRSSRGVVRGIHYAEVPPGQAKLVTCMTGRIRDVVVDIRVDSPTFGQWEAIDVSAAARNAMLLPYGVGHAFVALDDDTTVCYLVSDVYTPDKENGIFPLDPEIGIDFGMPADQLLLSPKDQDAPTLSDAHAAGLLPHVSAKEPVK